MIHHKRSEFIELGNLNAYRDWGHAKDYVEAMWKILQLDYPDDFVIASGKTHSVRDFVELAFQCINIQIVWDGEGIHEVGRCSNSNKVLVKVNPRFFRPSEVDLLHGNPSKAKKYLDWQPKYSFKDLVEEMVKHDIEDLNHVF